MQTFKEMVKYDISMSGPDQLNYKHENMDKYAIACHSILFHNKKWPNVRCEKR